MMKKCPEQLSHLKDGTELAMLQAHVEDAQVYHTCKDAHNALVEAIHEGDKSN